MSLCGGKVLIFKYMWILKQDPLLYVGYVYVKKNFWKIWIFINETYNMKYNVVKGNEVVKKNLSKKQAEEYCDKMNKEFMEKQESIRKQEHNAGLPLRKGKYELYKVEVVKESKIVRLTESDLVRIVSAAQNAVEYAISLKKKIYNK